MRRICIEIDDRFVTEWGSFYFGVRPTPQGMEFLVPPEPHCLPGFKYVIHPEAGGATFKFIDMDAAPAKANPLPENDTPFEKVHIHEHTEEKRDIDQANAYR